MSPNPIDDEELYTSLVLGGVRSPGTVTLSGHDRKVDWDVKQGAGQAGASTTIKGIPPVTFEASFYLVRDESRGIDDIAEWPAFQRVIESTVSGKTPKALDIYHPDLAENDIKSVCKALVGGAVHDLKGGQTRKVKFIEYRPPKPKGGSTKGSRQKATGKNKAPDPNAAAKAELEKLLKQYESTPWG